MNTFALAALMSWFIGTLGGFAEGLHHGVTGTVLGSILGCAIGSCIALGVFQIERRNPYRFKNGNGGAIRYLALAFSVLLAAPLLSIMLSVGLVTLTVQSLH